MTQEPGPAADRLSADLARLVSETRAADAARARSHERDLRHQATAEATLVGLFLDLAEEGAEVSLRTTSGRFHQGLVVGLGRDFVVVATGAGPGCVALRAVATVRRRPGHRSADAAGDRLAPRPLGMAAYLAGLAADRPRLAVAVDGEPELLRGELRSVGHDLLTMRLDGDPPVTTYVALTSVSDVLVSG